MKRTSKFSLFLSILLVVQLLFPIIGAFAAELQAPTNVRGYERYPGNVALEWDAVPSVASYKVYKLDGETKTFLTQVTSNKAFINVQEGTYTFAVSAIANGTESQLSSPFTLEIKFPEMLPPSNLKASVERFYDLTLSWNASEYVSYYKIYKVVNGKRELVTTTPNTNFTLTSLPEGDFLYEVTSYSTRFGESKEASQIEATIVYPEMLPPTNLTYTIQNGSDVALTWQSAKYANKYNIYKVVNGNREVVASTSNLNIVFSNVPEGDQVFEVTSYSLAYKKESKTAAQVTFPISYPKMNAPTNLTLSILNGNDGTLTWDKADFVDTYKVYQVINGEKVLLKHTPNRQISFDNLPEGNYVYEVSVYSSRFGESPTARIEYELVHPEMQPPSGVESYVLNVNNIYLKWNKSDYAVGYKVYQVVDGERILVGDTVNTFLSIANLSEGPYEYEITSYSDRFGESALASHVEAEVVFPEIKAPQNLQAAVNQDYKSIALWWDEVEYATSYNVYRIVNGEYEFIVNTPNTRTQFRDMAEGKYVYVVQAISKYGDSSYSNEVTATIEPDLEAPVAPVAVIEGDSIKLSWEPVQGADSYNVYEIVDGERIPVGNTVDTAFTLEDLETGNHEYEIVPVSESGLEGTESTTVTVTVEDLDTTPPVTTSNVSDEWINDDFTVQLTATDDKSGVDKTFYSINGKGSVEGTEFTITDEGIHKVYFYSIDKSGNVEEVKTVEVKIDKTVPETTSNVTDAWLNQAFTVELTATDDLSGVAKTYYSINNGEYVEGTSFELAEVGVHEVKFYSVDNAGNEEEAKIVEVKIDKAAPETESNVKEGWLTEAFTVELTATDDLSGVAKTYYSVNGSEFVEGTSFEVSEEGIHNVSFYSIDHAGNVEEAKTAEVKIDKTAPQLSWDLEEQYALGTNLTIAYEANDTLSGVAVEKVTVNGEVVTKGDTIPVDQPGEYNIQVTVTDNAGWETTVEKTFAVYILGDLEITPGIIKINKGVFTARVTLPDGLEADLDLSSATLNGVAAVDKGKGSVQQAAQGMFKFNREDFDWNKGEVFVEFRGMVNGQMVIASTTVTVK
ncbi:OmpL47-type beta-barrel domain-containing protein [Mesobacillus maritimus]|uniref:OmpL47-type beta-barrel domain-containing protein n=1 Tax=Mesobacillus maritimus TaxID=1643336 RepID=UPI00384ABB08